MSAVTEVLSLVNVPAENCVLTAMHCDSVDEALYYADRLTVTDFSNPRAQLAFQSMVNILHGADALDDKAILAESIHVAKDLKLPKNAKLDQGYLDSLTGDHLRARAYAETVAHYAWLRNAGDFAAWLIGELDGRPDPEELYAAAMEKMQALQPPAQDNRFVYGWDTVSAQAADLTQRVADHKAGKANPFLWPWTSWNALFRPLRKGMVGVIGAAEGVGKSTFLEVIAEFWASMGLHVIVVHLEDSLDYKLDRRLARWSGVPLDHIEDGNLTPEELVKIADAQRNIDDRLRTLHYFNAAGMTMAQIVSELTHRYGEGICQAIVLDYLNKVMPSREQVKVYGDQTYERQRNDMEQLKNAAEKLGVPVVTAAQGNKNYQEQGKKARRKDLTGSLAISQLAQFVALLYREEIGEEGLYDDNDVLLGAPGDMSPLVEVRVDKQNRGKSGVTITQFFDGPRFDVRDVEMRRVDLEY